MTSSEAPNAGHPGKKPLILVVEDNYLLADTVCEVAREMGCSVAGPVSRLEKGLDILERLKIQGALIDINLNGIDSYPLCHALRERNVPFAFITGYNQTRVPDRFRDAPFLGKPFHENDIRTALSRFIASHQASDFDRSHGNLLLKTLDPQ